MGLNDVDDKYGLMNGIVDLKNKTGVNRTLKEIDVTKKDIPQLAQRAMNDPCIVTNPVIPEKSDVEEIYKNAL